MRLKHKVLQPDERLLAIEEIKKLKARYFRSADCQDWPEYGRTFAKNGTVEVLTEDNAVKLRLVGRKAIVEHVKKALRGSRTMHHGHMPEIEILSAERASGVWAMEDWVIRSDHSHHGWGYYHEKYVREAGEWKIAFMRIPRLRMEVHTFGPLPLGPR